MCEPISMTTAITLASAGMSAAQTFMSFSAQAEQANAQNRAYEQNVTNARASYNNSIAQRQVRVAQEQDAAHLDKEQAARESQRRKATATVSAGEAGVGGLSVEALLAEYDRTNGEYQTSVNRQLGYNVQHLDSQIEGARIQTQGRFNSFQRAEGPSATALALSLTGDGLAAYDRYKYRPENKT